MRAGDSPEQLQEPAGALACAAQNCGSFAWPPPGWSDPPPAEWGELECRLATKSIKLDQLANAAQTAAKLSGEALAEGAEALKQASRFHKSAAREAFQALEARATRDRVEAEAVEADLCSPSKLWDEADAHVEQEDWDVAAAAFLRSALHLQRTISSCSTAAQPVARPVTDSRSEGSGTAQPRITCSVAAQCARAYSSAGICQLLACKFNQAIQLFDRAIATEPQEPRAWHNRAQAHFLRRNFELAAHDANRACCLEPDHLQSLQLARCGYIPDFVVTLHCKPSHNVDWQDCRGVS